MIILPEGRKILIPQNSGVVNTHGIIISQGFNAQNKEYVKRFIEKNLEPEAQNALAVNRFLKNYQDFFQRG